MTIGETRPGILTVNFGGETVTVDPYQPKETFNEAWHRAEYLLTKLAWDRNSFGVYGIGEEPKR